MAKSLIGISSSGVSAWESIWWRLCSVTKRLESPLCVFFFSLLQSDTALFLSSLDGSAIFKGCFHRPDNVTAALPFSAVIQNMSVDKCVDMCTEKVSGLLLCVLVQIVGLLQMMFVVPQEKSLAALAGERCYCGFPTPLFSLHELEEEDMCLQRCPGEEFESCGNDKFFVVYQTQVQGMVWCLLPAQSLAVCGREMRIEQE